MSSDQYEGIKRALTLAMYTGQSVNVGLNRGGEAVKVEGVIEGVYRNRFRIQLELEEAGPPVQLIRLAEVEYVEYS